MRTSFTTKRLILELFHKILLCWKYESYIIPINLSKQVECSLSQYNYGKPSLKKIFLLKRFLKAGEKEGSIRFNVCTSFFLRLKRLLLCIKLNDPFMYKEGRESKLWQHWAIFRSFLNIQKRLVGLFTQPTHPKKNRFSHKPPGVGVGGGVIVFWNFVMKKNIF